LNVPLGVLTVGAAGAFEVDGAGVVEVGDAGAFEVGAADVCEAGAVDVVLVAQPAKKEMRITRITIPYRYFFIVPPLQFLIQYITTRIDCQSRYQ
jgi:hypothetical protein